MSVHAANIQGPASTADIVHDWRARYCNGLLGQIAGASSSNTPPNSIVVKINGYDRRLRPSQFSIDNVLMLTVAPGNALRVVFYDLAAKKFLPAIAVLSVPERSKLGSPRDRIRNKFLRELIQSARTAQPRAAVGA